MSSTTKVFLTKVEAKTKEDTSFSFRNLKEYNDDCVFINSLDDGTSYCAGFEDHPPWPRCKGYVEFYIILLNDTCVVMTLLDSRSLVQSNGRTLAEGDPEGISERKTQHH